MAPLQLPSNFILVKSQNVTLNPEDGHGVLGPRKSAGFGFGRGGSRIDPLNYLVGGKYRGEGGLWRGYLLRIPPLIFAI